MALNLTKDQDFCGETDFIDLRIAAESLWHDDLTHGGVPMVGCRHRATVGRYSIQVLHPIMIKQNCVVRALSRTP